MAEDVTEPLVSVVSPFFNRRRYLPFLIATLRAQSYWNVELIIVDDASTDGLGDAVDQIREQFPIAYIRLASNRGGAAARNTGMDAARGKYIALLDSDDSWHPEKLRSQVRQLETSPGDGRLVSLTRQLVKGRRKYLAPALLMTREKSVGEYLFRCGGVIQSSMMMLRRELAVSVRFDDESRGHDDWSFALRLERSGAQFEMLGEPLTIYNDTEGRLRRSPHYSPARLKWLAEHRDQLGELPYWAAVAAVASRLPERTRTSSLQLIAAAYKCGAITTARALYYLTALYLPAVRTVTRDVSQLCRAGSFDKLMDGRTGRNPASVPGRPDE